LAENNGAKEKLVFGNLATREPAEPVAILREQQFKKKIDLVLLFFRVSNEILLTSFGL
jgi:hypothetical protein